MAFYDSDVYDSWGGTGTKVETNYEYFSLDEILNLLSKKGICNDSKEEKLLSIIAINNEKFNPFLVRKDKEDGKYKIKSSVFGSFDFCDIRTNIKKLDYNNNKALGCTYNGGYFSRYRKYWDYECPLKYVYMKIKAPLNICHNGIYINLNGTEAIVTNGIDGTIISRHKTTIDECLELVISRYNKYKMLKNDILTDNEIEKIIRNLNYVKERG